MSQTWPTGTPAATSGRRTLVCALCHAGTDAEPGTRVPLVVRGREGGLRRPHFAHPPGQAPVGGHHPESVWHLSAKVVLADWARRQPDVINVAVERFTPDRARRSDVRIRFRDRVCMRDTQVELT